MLLPHFIETEEIRQRKFSSIFFFLYFIENLKKWFMKWKSNQNGKRDGNTWRKRATGNRKTDLLFHNPMEMHRVKTVNCTPLAFVHPIDDGMATSYRIEIKFKLVLQVKLHENGLNTENYEINSLLIEFSTMNNFFLHLFFSLSLVGFCCCTLMCFGFWFVLSSFSMMVWFCLWVYEFIWILYNVLRYIELKDEDDFSNKHIDRDRMRKCSTKLKIYLQIATRWSVLQRRKFIAIKPIVDLYTSYYKCIIQMKLLKNMHIAYGDIKWQRDKQKRKEQRENWRERHRFPLT